MAHWVRFHTLWGFFGGFFLPELILHVYSTKSLVYQRWDTQPSTLTTQSPINLHVSGLWQETGAPGEKPRSRASSTHKGLNGNRTCDLLVFVTPPLFRQYTSFENVKKIALHHTSIFSSKLKVITHPGASSLMQFNVSQHRVTPLYIHLYDF